MAFSAFFACKSLRKLQVSLLTFFASPFAPWQLKVQKEFFDVSTLALDYIRGLAGFAMRCMCGRWLRQSQHVSESIASPQYSKLSINSLHSLIDFPLPSARALDACFPFPFGSPSDSLFWKIASVNNSVSPPFHSPRFFTFMNILLGRLFSSTREPGHSRFLCFIYAV